MASLRARRCHGMLVLVLVLCTVGVTLSSNGRVALHTVMIVDSGNLRIIWTSNTACSDGFLERNRKLESFKTREPGLRENANPQGEPEAVPCLYNTSATSDARADASLRRTGGLMCSAVQLHAVILHPSHAPQHNDKPYTG